MDYQSIDLQSESVNWLLYERDLWYERIKLEALIQLCLQRYES